MVIFYFRSDQDPEPYQNETDPYIHKEFKVVKYSHSLFFLHFRCTAVDVLGRTNASNARAASNDYAWTAGANVDGRANAWSAAHVDGWANAWSAANVYGWANAWSAANVHGRANAWSAANVYGWAHAGRPNASHDVYGWANAWPTAHVYGWSHARRPNASNDVDGRTNAWPTAHDGWRAWSDGTSGDGRTASHDGRRRTAFSARISWTARYDY